MRIKQLQLSNILSFPYVEDIQNAQKITLDPTLNIIIGSNGSGKSTTLEAINFIFKRVFFKYYEFNEQRFNDSSALIRKMAYTKNPDSEKYKNTFRLNPNWDSELDPQQIKVTIQLDDIDRTNFETLNINSQKISRVASLYSDVSFPTFNQIAGSEEIDFLIDINNNEDSFTITHSIREDIFSYLSYYELLRELIVVHNSTSSITDVIKPLDETFTMLSAFRNYNSFSNVASMSSNARDQLRNISQNNRQLGVNTQYGGEPSIFTVVKLNLASRHFDEFQGKNSSSEAEEIANNTEMIQLINTSLSIIGLKCSIKVLDLRSWNYSFEFTDILHRKPLGDIGNLSAGQRSIIHLIFEAYGRSDMNGGVVIIDEPEIHLHYQFQYEYLRIMQKIINERHTQFILVTHSDGFISPETAKYVKRFSLDDNRHSRVYSPSLSAPQKKMIEILDNKQSSRALFGNKVLLVEGPDDRYMFRSLFDHLSPGLKQDISIYDTHGRDSQTSWRLFFESYGLDVYQIKDLDGAYADIYQESPTPSLKTSLDINAFRLAHQTLDTDIEDLYNSKLFILKQGPLEAYMNFPPKGMDSVIAFCQNMTTFITEDSLLSKELLEIHRRITNSF